MGALESGIRGKCVTGQNSLDSEADESLSNMVLAHRALRDQMLRTTVMSTSDALLLFDVGAGQVAASLILL